jgi:hypothetical protein
MINLWVQLGSSSSSSSQPCVLPEQELQAAEQPPKQRTHPPHLRIEKETMPLPTTLSPTQAPKEAPAAITAPESANQKDVCQEEYDRVTANRTQGLTREDLIRSRTLLGNRQRLANLAHKLHILRDGTTDNNNMQPITMVVNGGSISLGHGVIPGLRYSDRLETWLNTYYPMPPNSPGQHRVLNKGSHGADVSIQKIIRGRKDAANKFLGSLTYYFFFIYIFLSCLSRFVPWRNA